MSEDRISIGTGAGEATTLADAPGARQRRPDGEVSHARREVPRPLSALLHPDDAHEHDAEARYAIGEEIASGGAGRVLRAHDRRLHREVALKELRHDHPTLRARFQREIRLTARLAHPNIVPLYDVGTWPSGLSFYAMKLVDGESLAEATRRCLSFTERSRLVSHVIDVADAIAYAHSQGIIHRDLKPLNVLVGPFGETLVIDWGLAKVLGDDDDDDDVLLPGDACELDAELVDGQPFATNTGAIIGTPGYMPPEQALGQAVDERADVYALGALLYQVLAGEAPYANVPRAGRLEAVVLGPPTALTSLAPEAPRDLVAIAEKAMAREPQQRYRTAGEMAEELRRYAAGRVVDAHDYSALELLGRFLRRHSNAVRVALVGLLALLAFGVWSFAAITGQRNRAEALARAESDARGAAETSLEAEALARAEAERLAEAEVASRAQAERRADELTVERARALLDRDPTMALAWLKSIRSHAPGTGPHDEARVDGAASVAAEAAERGVARRVLRQHEDVVWRVTASSDGRLVASAGSDARIAVYDVASGETRVLTSHRDRVVALAFGPDGERLFSGSYDGDVRVWSLDSGVSQVLEGHSGPVHDLSVSPDGRFVASIAADNTTRLWDLEAGTSEVIAASTSRERFARFSPDGRRLVTGSHGTAVQVHDLVSGRSSWLVGHRARVTSVAFSPDGHTLASGSADGSVWFWNLSLGSGAELAQLPRGESVEGRVLVAFSPDGQWFAWSSGAGIVELRSTLTAEMRTVTRHADRVSALRFSPDSRLLLSGGWDNEIHVSDLGSGARRVLRGHDDVISSLTVVPGEPPLLASGSWDKTVRLWPLASDGRRLQRGHTAAVNAVAVSPDGSRAVSASDDGTVREWDIASGAGEVLGHHGDHVRLVAWSPDGRFVASAGEDFVVQLHDRERRGLRMLADPAAGDILALAFAADGSRLGAAYEDGSVRVWPTEGGEPRVLRGHNHHVTALAFTADGQSLLTASRDRTVRLWQLDADAADPRGVELGRHEDDVWGLALSPDRRRVATVGGDGVRLWDLSGEEPVRSISARLGGARRVRFSGDGKLLAVGGGDDLVLLCEVATLACRALRATTGVVQDIELSPDGSILATASADNSIRLWDVATGENQALLGHSATVFDVAFAPDGRRLISGGGGGVVGLWPVRRPPAFDSLREWLDAQTDVTLD